MALGISVVINTLNEGKNIKRAINSVRWAEEVVVCDMHSTDKTAEIARKAGAKVILNEKKDYVELARNFNIASASHDWILILDPDEEVGNTLAKKLQDKLKSGDVSYVEIPRKNIIFGSWMKASGWWPDYNIRFFKKGNVVWGNEIHRPPQTLGKGVKLPAQEEYALIHHHYESVFQFMERMNRYTMVQAKELVENGYKFKWEDLLSKPLGEFLGRYFAKRGFEDGLHGLALSLLQAFSFLVMYLKVWEMEKFKEQEINLSDLKKVSQKLGHEVSYWQKYGNLSPNPVKRFLQKGINKLF